MPINNILLGKPLRKERIDAQTKVTIVDVIAVIKSR